MADRNSSPAEAEMVFADLREANVARQAAWCPDQLPDLSFRGNELAGETGEVCNVIKKLERERQGWRGSRDTVDHLAEELADVVICADLVAITAGIDLTATVAAKFNATSEKVGLPHRLAAAPKATETPGLREAVERELTATSQWQSFNISLSNGEVWKHQPSGETEFVTKAEFWRVVSELTGRIRAVLSATPQPVAVPDDGAGREEVVAWSFEIEQHDGRWRADLSFAKPHAPLGGAIRDVRTLVPASALSAERAAHEQTRKQIKANVTAMEKAADVVRRQKEAIEAERAEVARLRKALDAVEPLIGAAETMPGSATFTLAWLEARNAITAARSSREEGC